MAVQYATRKSLHCRPGVAEQHPARAVAVQDLLDQVGGGLSGVQSCRQVCGYLSRFQRVRQITPVPVLRLLLQESLQIVKTGGVQQAQACEVAGLANLFRRRSQEQQAGGFAGE